ncbi:hypothetical protein FRC11_000135 [Ceratobasidium sp. 423]|nr:hypothetical protein FRC11_000135 [Ceratobasidium sp. 423]
MKPGTYRIVNLASGTAITQTGLGEVASRTVDHDSKDQQWFSQRSGDVYRFRNVASGGYLAIASTDDCELYCGGYPTTWMLVANHEHRSHNTYGIIMGDTDRILDFADIPGSTRPDPKKASISDILWMP